MAHSVHNVLEAACKALNVDLATYDTGMKPVLSNWMYVDLVVWIAEQVAPKMDRARRELEKLIPLSRRVASGERLGKASASLMRSAEAAALAPANNNQDGRLVAALAMETLEADISNVCGKGSRQAASIAARLLGAPFLDALSDEILRLDAVTTVMRQKLSIGGAVITACLWRGTTGAKVTHIIVRLADGKHGLIAKTRGRWTWLSGERDDVLASIPDAQMESAVSAVLGTPSGEKKGSGAKEKAALSSRSADTPAAKRKKSDVGVVAKMSSTSLAAVAIGADGALWAATRDGSLVHWEEKRPSQPPPKTSDAEVGKVEGMHAGGNGIVVTWGKQLTRWRGPALVPAEVIDEKVNGAFVTDDDGSLVWWQGDQIRFGKKKKMVTGLPSQTLFLDRNHARLVAAAPSGCRLFNLDGVVIGELPIPAKCHSVSPSGERIATWLAGAATRSVLVSNVDDGKTLLRLPLDAGHVDRVVFASEHRVLVRYHAKKRVAVFDARGVRTHRIQARELGSRGSAIDELFPLTRGAVLAFGAYPHGDTLLLDLGAQLIERWQLGNLYSGGRSYLADACERVLFAHSRERTTYLLRF